MSDSEITMDSLSSSSLPVADWCPSRLCPMCYVMMGKTVEEVANHLESWHRLTFSSSVLAQSMFKGPLACEDVLLIVKDINQGRKKIRWWKKECTLKERELKCLEEKSRKVNKKEASNKKDSKVKQMTDQLEEQQTEPDKLVLCSNLLNELQRQSSDREFNDNSDIVKNACRKDIENLENLKNNIVDIKTIFDAKDSKISSLIHKAIDLGKDVELFRHQNNLLHANELKLEAEIEVLKTKLEEAKDFFNVELEKKYIAVNKKNAQLQQEIDQLTEATEKAAEREHHLKEAIKQTRTLFSKINGVYNKYSQKIIITVKNTEPATKTVTTEDPKLVSSEIHSGSDDSKYYDQSVSDMEEEYAEGNTVIKQEPKEEETMFDPAVKVKRELDPIPRQCCPEMFTSESEDHLCIRAVQMEVEADERHVRYVEPSTPREEVSETSKRLADKSEGLKNIEVEPMLWQET